MVDLQRVRQHEQRLYDHVDKLGAEHPPIDLATVDYTIRDARAMEQRFGHVLDYMARVELEVDRNVLELTAMLPDPPDVDRHFYADVWQPQEIRHGQILDEVQVRLGRDNAVTDLTSVSAKLRILGMLAHLEPMQDVVRMLYYLTGMSTERSAVLAYNLLSDGLTEIGEHAIAQTVVGQIKRQEPGHHAFYTMSARGHAEQLSRWQLWLVRRMRSLSFAPVGANNDDQRADFGDIMRTLGIDRDLIGFTGQIGKVEADLLDARGAGLEVPAYVIKAFREAVELAEARAAGGLSGSPGTR